MALTGLFLVPRVLVLEALGEYGAKVPPCDEEGMLEVCLDYDDFTTVRVCCRLELRVPLGGEHHEAIKSWERKVEHAAKKGQGEGF